MTLPAPLLRGLHTCGFERPTEIQARAVPPALEGRDLLASAQTGTGKTAAFALPALTRLLQPPHGAGHGPRVLVLTPTRELASQVEGVFRQLGRFTRLRCGVIVGGVGYAPQERLLRNPLDVLVSTPGRLIDHMERGLVDWSRLELLVLDEADRMLDMGFIRPVRQIAKALPRERQTLLFSATLEGEVQTISRELLRDPVRIQLASARVRHEGIRQRLHLANGPEHKHALLMRLLADPGLTQAIVFTGTKRGADRLAKRLAAGGHTCAALHGNMRQNARQRTLDDLRRGKVQILVATDVAARGMDILGVSHVINFDLPTVAEDYIHRIGRTGRNGATGEAISLVGPQDRVKLGHIERLTGQRLQHEELAGVEAKAFPAAAATATAGRAAQGPRGARRPSSARPGAPRPDSARRFGAPGPRRPRTAGSGNRRGPAAGNGSRPSSGDAAGAGVALAPVAPRRKGSKYAGARSSWSG